MRKFTSLSVVVAAVAAGAAPAMADMFDLAWYNQSVTGQVLGNDMGPADVYVTPFLLESQELGIYIKAFCIDLRQTAATSMDLVLETDLAGVPLPGPSLQNWQIGRLQKLFGEYWGELAWGSGYGIATSDITPENLINAAAFQLAVWEIVNETTQYAAGQYDVTVRDGTGFSVVQNESNAAAIQKANEWLRSLDRANLGSAELVALKSDTVQDFVYLTALSDSIAPSTMPVPAPGAAGLILIGLGAISGVRRKSA